MRVVVEPFESKLPIGSVRVVYVLVNPHLVVVYDYVNFLSDTCAVVVVVSAPKSYRVIGVENDHYTVQVVIFGSGSEGILELITYDIMARRKVICPDTVICAG